MHAKPFITPMRRGLLPARSCRHDNVAGLHRQSGRSSSPSGVTPSTIMSPARSQPGPWTEIRLGVRVHTCCLTNYPHAPPMRPLSPISPDLALDRGALHR